LNGTQFQGRALTVNEARPFCESTSQDRFSEIMKRFEAYYDRPESAEFGKVVEDLRETAEAGHVEAEKALADLLAKQGAHYDPESAYKWYYIALAQEGYNVRFEDQNETPPYYCGPIGDFRNESMISALVAVLGFDKVRSLDVQ